MITLWTKDEFLKALGGKKANSLHSDISGISIDARTIKRGEAFFAIKGDRFDGHDFALEAAQKGASVLVVTKQYANLLFLKAGIPLVIVDDTLSALERLAVAARARCHAKIVAVTGSVGKTTTKEIMKHAFSGIGKVHANSGSFNNHWGVPLTLACMPADTDFGIFEIAMNHKNEIRPLVKLVMPDVVVVTCIATAHLEHFDCINAIASAKAEIFEGPLTGTALLNADDAFFTYLKKKAHAANITHIVSYGEANDADYRLLCVDLHEDYACFKVSFRDAKEEIVKIGAPGRHMVQNVIAVLGVADILNVNIAQTVRALQDFTPTSGRGIRYRLMLPSGGTFLLIDESYNANPLSMRTGLASLSKSRIGYHGRRIAVLGDMLELGRFSREAHEKLANPICKSGISIAFLGGYNMKYLADVLQQHHDKLRVQYREIAIDLLPLLLDNLHAGDVVMVKSSNSIGLSHTVNALLKEYGQIQFPKVSLSSSGFIPDEHSGC